ncbi:hypothetical protein AB0C19_24410 [Micromonospora sp. NPDC048842]|uniref:hypothetical protein n=1 Tax=Micromonospora sp. NPDC048842 TaxID=3154346 RepID=UPI0033DF8E9C
MRRKAFRVGVIAAPLAAALALASPASAKSSTGFADDFFPRCDANVTVADDLVGSVGKIDAYGGFFCETGREFSGTMTLQLFKNGAKVSEAKKGVNGNGDSLGITVSNPVNPQDWRAKLTIFRPGFSSTIIDTGTIRS